MGNSRCKCCNFTVGLVIAALFMWQRFTTAKPKCFLQEIYVPALNQSSNSPSNTTLFFQLKLENTNIVKGVYYDPVNVTFFDSPNRTHSIGNFTIPKFYQGRNKKAIKSGEINDTGLDIEAVLRAVSNGSVVFRVDMATSVRNKFVVFKTKRRRINVGAYVNVSNQGTQVNPRKGVRLSSSVGKIGSSSYEKIGILLIKFFIFGF
ncbi:protein NDR1-like [Jatropha curcas]|uniref:protein NDR1-like n=1 Tax=Jatropha curcas TaxID=180498 RepID=UPI0005FBAFF3|nr:protein NDR1-like [Jatropha curcas]